MKLHKPNLDARKAEEWKVPQMPLITTPLHRLEMATDALLLFQHQQEKILSRLNELTEAVTVAEDEVRTQAKKEKRPLESEDFLVEYVEPKRRWYDPTNLIRALTTAWGNPKAVADFITATGVIVTETKTTVDEKLLKALVEAEKVPSSVMRAAYMEEPHGSARVTIKRK